MLFRSFEFNPYDLNAAATLMAIFDKANANGIIDTSIEQDLRDCRAKLGLAAPSAESLSQRLANNKTLMEAIRRPDVDQKAMTETSTEGSLEQARIQQETQLATAEIQAKAAAARAAAKPTPKPSLLKKAA